VIVILAAALVVLLGSFVPSPPGPASTPAVTIEPLPSAVQFCAGLTDILPIDPDAGDAAAPSVQARADAVAIADRDLAGAEVDGEPLLRLNRVEDGDESTVVASTTVRGQALSAETEASAVVTAAGELAPGVAADVTLTALDVRTSGLAGQPCTTPGREWWFAAGSGQVGQRATLVLGNPAQGPAVVDVTVWTESGVLPGAGTNDLGIPPGGTRTVSLDAVATGAARIGVSVTASVGRVGAVLGLREVEGADPVGLSWVNASQPPGRRAYVPGLPATGDRTVRLLNPGGDDAIVALRAVGEQGVFTPLGLEAIEVPAGQVVDVDLEPVGAEAFALEASANVPIVASALVRQSPGDVLADFAVVGSVPRLDASAATWVTRANTRSTRVVLTAVPDATEPTAPSPTQVVLRVVGPDGTLLSADIVTVPRGTTLTVPVDLPDGVRDAWLVVVPREPDVLLAARETTATARVPDALDPDTKRDAAWYDLVALRALRTTVAVPPVLPDVTAGLPR
jgi:hypothetical protein